MNVATTRKRTCANQLSKKRHNGGKKTIRLPIAKEMHRPFVSDYCFARRTIDEYIALRPELFPPDITKGYTFHSFSAPSKKLNGLRCRRIKLNADGEVFMIAPSFVMPYMTAYSADVSAPLLLICFAVPLWVLTLIFGHNDQYWYRLAVHFGRNSLVGTTVKDPKKLPRNLLADEKHTWQNGLKRFIAMTVGKDCILGAAMAADAGVESLKKAYGIFAEEARNVDPAYKPDSVNIDGWPATKAAWLAIFASVYVVLCFLHAFIKIRARCKHMGQTFVVIRGLVWDAYHSKDAESFLAKTAELRETAQASVANGPGLDAIMKLCAKSAEYAETYNHPGVHRTSTGIDRVMDRIDRILYSNKYFHGHLDSAEDRVRAIALLNNFRPYCPRSEASDGFTSPAHRLNGFVYADSWLENLLVSASMCGFRWTPQNP